MSPQTSQVVLENSWNIMDHIMDHFISWDHCTAPPELHAMAPLWSHDELNDSSWRRQLWPTALGCNIDPVDSSRRSRDKGNFSDMAEFQTSSNIIKSDTKPAVQLAWCKHKQLCSQNSAKKWRKQSASKGELPNLRRTSANFLARLTPEGSVQAIHTFHLWTSHYHWQWSSRLG